MRKRLLSNCMILTACYQTSFHRWSYLNSTNLSIPTSKTTQSKSFQLSGVLPLNKNMLSKWAASCIFHFKLVILTNSRLKIGIILFFKRYSVFLRTRTQLCVSVVDLGCNKISSISTESLSQLSKNFWTILISTMTNSSKLSWLINLEIIIIISIMWFKILENLETWFWTRRMILSFTWLREIARDKFLKTIKRNLIIFNRHTTR